MKIILLENVRKVGSIGEIIDVKRGFARNYLISKKKALFASTQNVKEVEKIKISKRFWFNFGQIIGELPHIDKIISSKKVLIIGHKKIQKGPAILIGAHLANWEFLLRVGEISGRRVSFVYRPINNWILNKLQFSRNSKINADFFFF